MLSTMRKPFTFESMVSEPDSLAASRSCSFSNIDHHSSSNSEDDISIGASSCRPVVGRVELKRSITLFGVIVILISNIGGTGVFIAPSTVLQLTGSPGLALILWSVGGFIQALLACCVAELSQFFGNAGGPYFFIDWVFGNLASFVFLWSYLIFIAAPLWALGAYTASLYLLSLVFTDCPPPEGLVKLLAAWILSK